MNAWVLPEGYQGHPAAYLAIGAAALLLTAVAKGGFAGVGALSVPLMLLVAPGKLVLGMWLPLLVVCDILTIRQYPREWKLRPIAVLAPSMILGIVLGYLMLGRVSDRTVKIATGVIGLLFVGLEFVKAAVRRRSDRAPAGPPWRPGLLSAAPFGLAAGVTTMLAHAAGTVTTIYFLPQRMDQRTFVGTTARFYFLFNSLKVPFFVAGGLINRETLVKSLWMMALAPLGVWLGARLNELIPARAFGPVILVLLAVSSVYLVWANL